MISPYPLIRVLDVPRRLFPFYLWWMLISRTLTGQVRWLLIDNERTLRTVRWWCRRFHLTPVLVRECEERYELLVDGRVRSLSDIFGVSTREGPQWDAEVT